MIDNYFFGREVFPFAQNPDLNTLHYVFKDGAVFYRVTDIYRIVKGKNNRATHVRDTLRCKEAELISVNDGFSMRASLYLNFAGVMYLVEHLRDRDLENRVNFQRWLAEINAVLIPKAAVWEPELPKAEPPKLRNTEELPPAYEQGAKLAKEAHDARKARAEEETPEIWQVQEENTQLLEEVDRLRRERDSVFASAAELAEEADKQKQKEKEKKKGQDCTCQNRPFVPNITSGQVKAANQMVDVWKAAGIDSKMIAMALNGFFPNLSLPVGAFTETDTEYYSANAIAAYVGVYSKKGNPHGGAVAAIIKRFLQLSDEDICKLPFNQNGHSGVCTQYSAAVLAQVEDWFDRENYPECVSIEGKTYHLCYDAM